MLPIEGKRLSCFPSSRLMAKKKRKTNDGLDRTEAPAGLWGAKNEPAEFEDKYYGYTYPEAESMIPDEQDD